MSFYDKLKFDAQGLIPAIVNYGSSALFGTLVRDQMSTRFVPSLLVSAFFWKGWARRRSP